MTQQRLAAMFRIAAAICIFVGVDAAAQQSPWRVLLLADDLSLPASQQQATALQSELVAHADRPVEVFRVIAFVVGKTGHSLCA